MKKNSTRNLRPLNSGVFNSVFSKIFSACFRSNTIGKCFLYRPHLDNANTIFFYLYSIFVNKQKKARTTEQILLNSVILKSRYCFGNPIKMTEL